jgi:hypothetical protein
VTIEDIAIIQPSMFKLQESQSSGWVEVHSANGYLLDPVHGPQTDILDEYGSMYRNRSG